MLILSIRSSLRKIKDTIRLEKYLKRVNPDLALTLIIINLFYIYTLSYGYILDDFFLVPLNFNDAVRANTYFHFRPIWYLSYPLVNLISNSAFSHRLTNLILLNISIYLSTQIIENKNIFYYFLIAIFLHPSFFYSTTWISQRNDTILIIMLLSILISMQKNNINLAYWFTITSNLAKSPFIFHNIFIMHHLYQRKKILLFVSILVIMATLIVIGIIQYSEADSPLASMKIDSYKDLIIIVFSMILKILNGVLTIFIPYPSFILISNIGFIIALLYIVYYSLAVVNFKYMFKTILDYKLLFVSILTSIPFAISDSLRLLAPAIILYYLFIINNINSNYKYLKLFIVGIIALNIISSSFIYNINYSKCYDLNAVDPICLQRDQSIPLERFEKKRAEITENIINNFLTLLF